MKKSYLLIAAALGCVFAVPVGYGFLKGTPPASARGLNVVEPSAGETADTPAEGVAVPAAPLTPVVPAAVTQADAEEDPPIRMGLDKAEIIKLDRDVVNVLVGSDKNLRVVPDTNRTLVLIPKQPGSTYFKALDNEGHVIMQRHVIIGSPKSDYIRIRRACVNGAEGCRQYSVYYCPDMCHEVSVSQDEKKSSPTVPADAPTYRSSGNEGSEDSEDSEDSESQDTTQSVSPPADIAQ
jgi:Flp pilus assembly secretin CpaC